MSRAAGAEAYRLRAGEPLGAGVQRIARHEIDRILHELSGRLDEEAVHEARKATKRVRALLRLVRDQLGARVYRRENRVFRDAARALSPARDAEVLAGTLDRLVERGNGAAPRGVALVRRAARARVRRARAGDVGAARRRVVAAMRTARARTARWPVAGDGWPALAPGLRRIYRRARKTWKAARAAPTVARLHEWRKRTKDLRYAVELLEPLWPEVLRALAAEVDALGERLGEDHDLALLRRFVRAEAARTRTDPGALVARVDAARRALQDDAWALAARIYEAPTRRFVRRLAAYWRAWSVETAAPA